MPRCKHCARQATFGYRASRTPIACKTHKQEKMIDLKHPPCVHCDRRPSFASHAGLPATHCKLHKLEGMQNVKHALCFFCGAYASFGYLKNRPVRCFDHKTDDMKNVKSTYCRAPNCTSAKPKYGNGTVGRAFCELHYNPLEHWKVTTCCKPLCLNPATHSDQAVFPFVFCEAHAPPSFSAATLQPCVTCGEQSLTDQTRVCYRHLVNQSTEKVLKDFLLSRQLTFVYNRCVPNSKKRPDFLFATPNGHIVVENDEHRHRASTQEEELLRMNEIQNALQTPVHFIRFNPDLTAEHVEPLLSRHEYLHYVLQNILVLPEQFFSQHQGLTVRYLFY